MKKYNWNLLSKNRNGLMGISILWLMLFHSRADILHGGRGFFAAFQAAGELGVDIFLLLSGISLYYSLKKNSDIWKFYTRRLRRVLLPTLMVMIPYRFGIDVLKEHNLMNFFLRTTGLTLFVNGLKQTWFVTAILLMYLVYPWLHRWFTLKNWSAIACALALTMAVAWNWLVYTAAPEFYRNCSILLERIPIFITGAWLGKKVYDSKTLILPTCLVGILSILAVILAMYGRKIGWLIEFLPQRYLYGLCAIPITVGMSALLDYGIIANQCCGWLAPVTLEIYLMHEKILSLCEHILLPGTTKTNLIAVALTIPGAFCLHWLEQKFISFIER